ncbi:MAG: ComF family protein [Clostridia bacterium]|nr:ComF family protein [Clostridia bacterium]
MTRKEFVRRFIIVHKCGGCGEILHHTCSDDALCSECRLRWNAALTEGCEKCFKPAVECTCMSPLLSGSGALSHRKLFFYDSENTMQAQMRMIFSLKRQKSRRLRGFAAEQLYPFVVDEVSALDFGGNKQNFAVCSCPRGVESKTLYGFDHAELLAKSLAELLGVEHLRLFYQRIGGKEQKDLDRKQRLENAGKHIVMRKNVDVSGKYLIIYDDMVTTGASMSTCIKLALKAGARGVICCSLACSKKQ